MDDGNENSGWVSKSRVSSLETVVHAGREPRRGNMTSEFSLKERIGRRTKICFDVPS